MAAPATPLRTPHKQLVTAWLGRFLARFAAFVQYVSARHTRRPDVALRNRAMRAASSRGVDRHALVRATRLSAGQVMKILAREPADE
ncbi:hypothetical protein EF910_15000 [Streptomyces sp. WAC07149]|uniref:hypothetical protein n=1 Tax=Streptomyces sp. WAC07149 TaxID=2487425 RepID=UPI000F76A327|nr:hypothetical protein [Streptomyces sp. WAC07149]RST04803.1 hypothetical protein EF910_15000 [Streptomyces sp. WAC07149]